MSNFYVMNYQSIFDSISFLISKNSKLNFFDQQIFWILDYLKNLFQYSFFVKSNYSVIFFQLKKSYPLYSNPVDFDLYYNLQNVNYFSNYEISFNSRFFKPSTQFLPSCYLCQQLFFTSSFIHINKLSFLRNELFNRFI